MRQQVVDDVVLTRHPDGTSRSDLTARLTAASTDPVRAVFAAPLLGVAAAAPDGHLLSLTPRTDPLPPEMPPPWREAGSLLARLHRMVAPATLPTHAGKERLAESVAEAATLKPGGSTDILRELGMTLLDTWPDLTWRAVVHGDWGLGKLARLPGTTTLVLTEPWSLGLGDPAWDLGRPAGLWAAGLLDEHSWSEFVAGYSEGEGAFPGVKIPWESLEHPARGAVFRAAVRELKRSGDEPSEVALTLVKACVKINGRRW